jgi:hypothetical protein
MEITGEALDVILDALGEQLRSLGEQTEVVVIGGSALTALGLVKRATRLRRARGPDPLQALRHG